jgi:hypothetical protein
MLALETLNKWNLYHMDVKLAFLNGPLKEEVYVRQPPGFLQCKNEGKALLLRKAL